MSGTVAAQMNAALATSGAVPRPGTALSPHPDRAVAKEDQLKALCREYFLAQQALKRGEDEAVQLETTERSLHAQVLGKDQEGKKLVEAHNRLKQTAGNLRYYGPHTTMEVAQEHLTEEKKLTDSIIRMDTQLKTAVRRQDSLKAQLAAESKTVNILRDSLTSQGKYNSSLLSSLNQTLSSHKRTTQQLCDSRARTEILEEQKVKVFKQAKTMKGAVASRSVGKQRAQENLHNYDLDALRMRKDTSYAKKMYLAEVEHGRDQELFLQQLLSENRKLKIIAANRRVTVPGITGDNLTGTANAGAGSKTHAGGEEHSEILDIDGNAFLEHDNGKQGKQAALDLYRTENKKLLQQVVDTMNLLTLQLQEQQDATNRKLKGGGK